MAVAVRAVGTFVYGTGDVAPGLPSGWQAGDLHIILAEIEGTQTLGTPSGWNLLTSSTNGGTKMYVFWRTAQTGDTAPTLSDPGDHIVARMIGFYGQGTDGNGGIVDNYLTASTNVADTQKNLIPAGSLTGANTGSMFMMMASDNNDQSVTDLYSAWEGDSLTWTERIDNSRSSGSGGGIAAATAPTDADQSAVFKVTPHYSGQSVGGGLLIKAASSAVNSTISCDKSVATTTLNSATFVQVSNPTISSSVGSSVSGGNAVTVSYTAIESSTISCDTKSAVSAGNGANISPVKNSTISSSPVVGSASSGNGVTISQTKLSTISSSPVVGSASSGNGVTIQQVKHSTISANPLAATSSGNQATVTYSNVINSTISCDQISASSSGNGVTVQNVSNSTISANPIDTISDGNDATISTSSVGTYSDTDSDIGYHKYEYRVRATCGDGSDWAYFTEVYEFSRVSSDSGSSASGGNQSQILSVKNPGIAADIATAVSGGNQANVLTVRNIVLACDAGSATAPATNAATISTTTGLPDTVQADPATGVSGGNQVNVIAATPVTINCNTDTTGNCLVPGSATSDTNEDLSDISGYVTKSLVTGFSGGSAIKYYYEGVSGEGPGGEQGGGGSDSGATIYIFPTDTPIDIVANHNYRMRFSYRVDGTQIGVAQVALAVAYFDENGTYVGYADVAYAQEDDAWHTIELLESVTSSEWTDSHYRKIAPIVVIGDIDGGDIVWTEIDFMEAHEDYGFEVESGGNGSTITTAGASHSTITAYENNWGLADDKAEGNAATISAGWDSTISASKDGRPLAYDPSGVTIQLTQGKVVNADASTASSGGNGVTVKIGPKIYADAGSATSSGNGITIKIGPKVYADSGSASSAGNQATVTWLGVTSSISASKGAASSGGNTAKMTYLYLSWREREEEDSSWSQRDELTSSWDKRVEGSSTWNRRDEYSSTWQHRDEDSSSWSRR